MLSWALSHLLEAVFCIETLRQAPRRGRPEIFNTDQKIQFTGGLEKAAIRISMDSRDRVWTT